jgi:hypothetical protein
MRKGLIMPNSGSGNHKLPRPPAFDPLPSGRFACRVLRQVKVEGALIGRVAVWAWVTEPSQQGFTKDVDVAVSRDGLFRLRQWLQDQGFATRELAIGGVNVKTDEGVNLDFIARNVDWGDLGALYEDAVREAIESGRTMDFEDEALPLVSPEHLTLMKLSTMEPRDEEDARRILAAVDLDVAKLRRLAKDLLGPLGSTRLEVLLREVGHPQARLRRLYDELNDD